MSVTPPAATTKEEQPEKKEEEQPVKKEEQQPEKEQQPAAKAAAENRSENSNEEAGNKEKIDAEARQKAEEEKNRKRFEEETTVINPCFSYNLGYLEGGVHSDVTIEFTEQKGMIRAHQVVLDYNSNTMKELFHGHQVDAHCTYDAEAKKVEWEILGGDKDAYRIAMERCIKFCYGAPLHVSPVTAAATIDVLFRLKLNGGQEIQRRVEQHMVDVAQMDVESGSLMLHRCAEYERAGYSGFTMICTTLAKTVLTPENIEKHKQLLTNA